MKTQTEILYERLLKFAKGCQILVFSLPITDYNKEYGKQLLRSSSSVGANYIEAQEAMGKKDFIYRLRVSRKESKESVHWLKLIESSNRNLNLLTENIKKLKLESEEFIKIFSSSIITLEKK